MKVFAIWASAGGPWDCLVLGGSHARKCQYFGNLIVQSILNQKTEGGQCYDDMTIVKTARWWIQKYAPHNIHKFDISAGNENVSFDIKLSCGTEDTTHHRSIFSHVVLWAKELNLSIVFLRPLGLRLFNSPIPCLLHHLYRSASRIVAMSFCEPRSWIYQLSS